MYWSGMLQVGRSTRVAVGAGAGTPEELADSKAKGLTFLTYGSDYSILAQSARVGLAAFNRDAGPS